MIVVHGKHGVSRRSGNPVPILLGVSFCLLLAGSLWYGFNAWRVADFVETTGTVVAVVPQGRGYTPEINFTASDGAAIEFHPYSSQSPSPYAVGDTVTVYYPAAHPQQAILKSFVSLWFGPMMLGIAGLVDAIVALGLWLRRSAASEQL